MEQAPKSQHLQCFFKTLYMRKYYVWLNSYLLECNKLYIGFEIQYSVKLRVRFLFPKTILSARLLGCLKCQLLPLVI